MGLIFGKLYHLFQSNTPCRILMVGLDGAGKTTILYKLKLGEVVTTIPTIGFNVENVDYKSLRFTVWDVGGQEKIRDLWRHYYYGTQGIIYVIDSNDPSRLGKAGEELNYMLESEELRDCPVLVYANKQDLPEAVSFNVVTSALGMTSLGSRPWHVQGTCAVTGAGIYEGIDWLAFNVKS